MDAPRKLLKSEEKWAGIQTPIGPKSGNVLELYKLIWIWHEIVKFAQEDRPSVACSAG